MSHALDIIATVEAEVGNLVLDMKTPRARSVLFLLFLAFIGAQNISGAPLKWLRAEIETSTTKSPADLGSVAYGNGKYLAFGNGSEVFYADSQSQNCGCEEGQFLMPLLERSRSALGRSSG